MTLHDYLAQLITQPAFLAVAGLGLSLLAAGIILHFVASGFSVARAFSGGVYDLTVLVFLYWVVFMLTVEYSTGTASDFLTNLPLPSYFPNPLDWAATGVSRGPLAFFGTLGRIWFLGLQIELFTFVILDLFPTGGFISHYTRQALVVCITVILNSALQYYLGQLFPRETVDLIYALVAAALAIVTLIMGIAFFINPLALFFRQPLFELFLAPTFTTAIAYIAGLLAIAFDPLQSAALAVVRFTESDMLLLGGLALLMLMLWALLYRLLRKAI